MIDRIGPYEVLDKLGSGGMGTVYSARHHVSGQVVALKVIRENLAEDPSYVRRFRREAAIAQLVESPNVVAVLEVGQQDGLPFIAMELIEGESLASLLRKSGPLPLDEALDIAVQVAQGLHAANQKGVIHRDISPQNVVVTPDGTAKIADFGIARSQTSGALTGTGMFIGKPSYAAPEMLDGDADTRSDIYSLGIVLFEMLSGRPPFIASNPLAVMDMQMRQTPPSLNDLGVRVPQTAQDIINKCLEKEPADRFQSPRDLLLALTRSLPRESADLSYQVHRPSKGLSHTSMIPSVEDRTVCRRCGIVDDDPLNFCGVCGEFLADRTDDEGVYWIEVPFPSDSAPRAIPIDIDSNEPFKGSYLTDLGHNHRIEPAMRSWEWGATIVWELWRDYFADVLTALAESGWSLAEPFEEYGPDGFLIGSDDRFTFNDAVDAGKGKSVFVGATFRMRRSPDRR